MQSLKDLWCGVTRNPWRTAGYIFTAFSVLFTIVKGINQFFPGVKIEGAQAFVTLILASVVFGLRKVWKPSKICFKVKNTNAVIEVLFGDLFQQDGIRAIAVSEFFDSKFGKPVSDKSIHGVFLKKCFGGHPEPFDKQVTEELQDVEYVDVADKTDGKTKSYPIGSSAIITVDQDRYLAFAFAKAEPKTCKAYSDVTMMWIALNHLWQRARSEAGGHALNLPLVGSGLSGLGLPTRDLLNLIILSAITETKARQITEKIRVVLHRDRFEDLDLRDVREHWEEQ